MKTINFSKKAAEQYSSLEKSKDKNNQFKAVKKTLYLMTSDLRHPSLNTHEYSELSKVYGHKIFESYAQNNTPGAYRIFWHYGPDKDEITITSIQPHP